jgi:anti-sigma B factor antagonist
VASYQRFHVENTAGVTIVRLLDRQILPHENLEQVGEELTQLVESQQPRNLLLDFSAVKFLASTVLGRLLILNRRVKEYGGKIHICSLHADLREIFRLTKLDEVFVIREEEHEAMAAFAD